MAQSTTRKNRLAGETSPYLLLHQHNPVDWHPWGPEALEKARAEEKPIFLSVGYATCHWCHVMERESFSDERTAELLNREFVNVKVDREERPELDEIYMTATQLLSSHGGWPNSVFLTPELKPFYAGTYFPPEDRHGMPGFRRLLTGLSEAWRERRADVELHADELAQAMKRYLEERGEPASEPPGAAVAERSLELLERRFDGTWGGFGGAPKFPTPSNLYLLLDFAGESPRAAEMLEATLDRMARGGIYDQLAGGFHRYATDREWKIPHFEKMLYDNAQLLEIYAREHERSGDAEAARVARETFAFLERELSAPEGGFWSAIDAESEGREGGYHAWTREQIETILGEEDATFLAPIYGFEGPPFFEGEEYVLHLPEPLEAQAERRHQGREELLKEIAPLRQKLLEARETRPSPLVDDKILVDWNGMAIAGLAEAGRLLGEPAMVERAARAAEFVLGEMRPEGGPLRHTYRGGEARIDAFLADYAFLIRGLSKLHRATGEGRWLEAAVVLADEMIERLGDAERGGFFVATEEPDVLFRSKEIFDGALPSANAVAALDLLELAEASGEARFCEEAEKVLKAFAAFVEQQPDAARMLALAARRYRQEIGSARSAPPGAAGKGDAVADLGAEARSVLDPALAWEEDAAEGFRRFRLEVRVREGWHVYAHEPGHEAAVATELEAEGAELRALEYPEGVPTRLGDGGDEVRIYEGRFDIGGEARAADVAEARLLLSYQPCELTRCLPPVTVTIPLD